MNGRGLEKYFFMDERIVYFFMDERIVYFLWTKGFVYLFMSERICVKKSGKPYRNIKLSLKKAKKKKYKRRDAERLLYAFVSNIPSQEFLSNGLYLRVQLFSDSLQVSCALFPSCISRLQMVPGILFITLIGMH